MPDYDCETLLALIEAGLNEINVMFDTVKDVPGELVFDYGATMKNYNTEALQTHPERLYQLSALLKSMKQRIPAKKSTKNLLQKIDAVVGLVNGAVKTCL